MIDRGQDRRRAVSSHFTMPQNDRRRQPEPVPELDWTEKLDWLDADDAPEQDGKVEEKG